MTEPFPTRPTPDDEMRALRDQAAALRYALICAEAVIRRSGTLHTPIAPNERTLGEVIDSALAILVERSRA